MWAKDIQEEVIEDYVDIDSAVVRKQGEHTEAEIKQEQEDMRNTEKARVTTRKDKQTLQEKFNTPSDSLSNLESSDTDEDGEYKEVEQEDTEQDNISIDDEATWLMGTNCNSISQGKAVYPYMAAYVSIWKDTVAHVDVVI